MGVGAAMDAAAAVGVAAAAAAGGVVGLAAAGAVVGAAAGGEVGGAAPDGAVDDGPQAASRVTPPTLANAKRKNKRRE